MCNTCLLMNKSNSLQPNQLIRNHNLNYLFKCTFLDRNVNKNQHSFNKYCKKMSMMIQLFSQIAFTI